MLVGARDRVKEGIRVRRTERIEPFNVGVIPGKFTPPKVVRQCEDHACLGHSKSFETSTSCNLIPLFTLASNQNSMKVGRGVLFTAWNQRRCTDALSCLEASNSRKIGQANQ